MPPRRISMLGLSKWESVFVQTTVDLASGIEISPWRFVNDPSAADVVLVDANRTERQVLEQRNGSERPIVVSFSADPGTTGRALSRPVSYGDLVGLLKSIETELAGPDKKPTKSRRKAPPKQVKAPAGEITPAPPDPPAPADSASSTATDVLSSPVRTDESLADKSRPARRFVEGTRLIGMLQQIVEHGKPVEVMHLEYPSFMVFPAYRAYATTAESLAIPGMYRDSALAFMHRPIEEKVAAKVLASDRCKPLGWLLYCAALFGSEGRLLLNCKPRDKLRLVDWPDFDALPHLPEHRTIAKFMLVHTASMAEIASATGVSLAVVVDFCNACKAAGLVTRDVADPVDDNRNGVRQLVDRVRGFFGDD